MNQVAIFRLLIVASLALEILGTLVDVLVPGLLPPELEDAYEAHAAAEEPTLSLALALGGLGLVLLIAAVVGTIGLWLFKAWGRQLSLWLSAIAMLSSPFFGPVVYSGWASMLTDVSLMLWGAVLAMAYFSEIKVRFGKDFPENAMQAARA